MNLDHWLLNRTEQEGGVEDERVWGTWQGRELSASRCGQVLVLDDAPVMFVHCDPEVFDASSRTWGSVWKIAFDTNSVQCVYGAMVERTAEDVRLSSDQAELLVGKECLPIVDGSQSLYAPNYRVELVPGMSIRGRSSGRKELRRFSEFCSPGAFSPNKEALLVCRADGEAFVLFRMGSFSRREFPCPPEGGPLAVAMDRDERIWVVNAKGVWRLREDFRSYEQLFKKEIRGLRSFAVSPEGDRWGLFHDRADLYWASVEDRNPRRRRFRATTNVWWSKSLRSAVRCEGRVFVHEDFDGERRELSALHYGAVRAVSMAFDMVHFASADTLGEVRVFRTDSEDTVWKFEGAKDTTKLWFSPDGKLLHAFGEKWRVYELENGMLAEEREAFGVFLSTSLDGRFALFGRVANLGERWLSTIYTVADTATGNVCGRWSVAQGRETPFGFFSPDATCVYFEGSVGWYQREDRMEMGALELYRGVLETGESVRWIRLASNGYINPDELWHALDGSLLYARWRSVDRLCRWTLGNGPDPAQEELVDDGAASELHYTQATRELRTLNGSVRASFVHRLHPESAIEVPGALSIDQRQLLLGTPDGQLVLYRVR